MSSQYGSISWNGGALWSSNGYLATNVEKSMEINQQLLDLVSDSGLKICSILISILDIGNHRLRACSYGQKLFRL